MPECLTFHLKYNTQQEFRVIFTQLNPGNDKLISEANQNRRRDEFPATTIERKVQNMLTALFLFNLYGSFVMLAIGIIKMILDGAGAVIKGDSGTAYRRAKDRALGRHFLRTIVMFCLAMLIAQFI